eukprot:g2298.t1
MDEIDYNPLSVISSDHADESLNTSSIQATKGKPRVYTPQEVRDHEGKNGQAFYGVVDGFVVDATEFLDSHPGGLKKLMAVDNPKTGATGKAFGFSFTRGRNAHFGATGKAFRDGVQNYLNGALGSDGFLKDGLVTFQGYGNIKIVGKLG